MTRLPLSLNAQASEQTCNMDESVGSQWEIHLCLFGSNIKRILKGYALSF